MLDDATPLARRLLKRKRDGKLLVLAMSDEFNRDGRDFSTGQDNLFEAVNKPDYTNEAIQFYNSSKQYVTTRDGNLIIYTEAVKTHYIENGEHRVKNYTSGMVQSWNKFCFTGGTLEMSIELPGGSDAGGLWPAAWLMGNLARATYEASTMHVWPWSYDQCGSIDHLEYKQEINACSDSPGYGLNPRQGRGAPEIDIFEVMPGHEMPGRGRVKAFMSSSLQVAPGIPKNMQRPRNGHPLNASTTWYDGLKVGKGGKFNEGFWGQECGPVHDPTPERRYKYMEDAISVNTDLEDTHFLQHHTYKLEWQPGKDGFLYWYLDDELIFGIEGQSVHSLTGALIPEEPMYLILNTAISHRWGMPEPCPAHKCSACWQCYDCTNPDCQCSLPDGMKGCKNLPAEMRVDYIRLYQDPADPTHTVGCSPASHPTAQFIAEHHERYKDWAPSGPPRTALLESPAAIAMYVALCGLLLYVVYRCYKLRQTRTERAAYTSIPGSP